MSTIVGVEKYSLFGQHGVYDYEREQAQPFIVSLWVKIREKSEIDDLESSVDYGFLQSVIHDVIVQGESVQLMETLCSKIIGVVSEHGNVEAIKIRIEKPEAPMPHEGGLALVEQIWPDGLIF